MILKAVLFFGALVSMEGIAYLTHKHVMHGWLWCLHESHHRRRTGPFELNDLFVVFFASISIIVLYLGVHGYPLLLWVGLGMTGYGVLYFMFHEVTVHQRIPFPYKPRSRYMKRIIKAHRMHHDVDAAGDPHRMVSFGFLYAPPIEKLKQSR